MKDDDTPRLRAPLSRGELVKKEGSILKIVAVCACPTVIIFDMDVNVENILEDAGLRNKACAICDHYTYGHKEVKRDITILYGNMTVLGIDSNPYVVDKIKNSMDRYIQCFNLQGFTSKLLH